MYNVIILNDQLLGVSYMKKLDKFLLYAKRKEAFRVKLQRGLLLATEAIDSYTELKINEFIANAIEKHSGIYLYDNIIKTNKLNSKVIVTCPIHGDFSIHKKDHLSGYGCPHCKLENINVSDALTPEDVYGDIGVNKQQLEHIRVKLINFLMGKDILALEKVIGESECESYTKRHVTEELDTVGKCPIHGIYSIMVSKDSKYHCIKCMAEDLVGVVMPDKEKTKNTKNMQKTIYLVKVIGQDLYKIGVTSNINRRMKELRDVKFVCGCITNNAYTHENILHKEYKAYNYYNEEAVGRGATEYFKLTQEQVWDIMEYMEKVSLNNS